MSLAQEFRLNPHWLPANRPNTLAEVPGEDGWPLVGTTINLLRDPPGFVRRMHDTYGRVYRSNSFGGRLVNLLGAEANELVLFDRDRVFSSEQGWGPMLNLVFPRGLIAMDFDKHRVHRKAIMGAFKAEPMRLYCAALNEGIAARVAAWRGTDFDVYPAIKGLTLDLAATSFLGIPWGAEAAQVNKAFYDMVTAVTALVRVPLPGTPMGRGVAGRSFLARYFRGEIPARRAGDAQDIFSQVCRASHEDGALLSDDEIVDHMNFLMMAAHDTTTSALTAMIMLLARNQGWQDRLRDEMRGLGLAAGEMPTQDRLSEMVLTDHAFREALRLMPPVPSIPRRALKPFSFQGFDFPSGTFVNIHPGFTHRMAEYWPDPDRFDPTRFEPEAVRVRHKYAWTPFGGGAHMCLGLHFAIMQSKILLYHLLVDGRVTPRTVEDKWRTWPIPKPVDGLPIRHARIA